MLDLAPHSLDLPLFCAVLVLIVSNALMLHLILKYIKQLHTHHQAQKQQDSYIKTLEQRLSTQTLHLSPDSLAPTETPHDAASTDPSEKTAALSRLAGGLAHDFNNILSIIDGYARLCLKDTDLKAPLREYLEKIDRAAQRGAQLTHKMTIFGHHQAKTNTVIDVNTVLRTAKNRVDDTLPLNITVHMKPSAEPLVMRTHNDALSQIMDELFKNACNFMPSGGDIIVQSSRCALPGQENSATPAFIKISVKDSGSGIEQHNLSQIFDPFYTTDSTHNQSGLGLSVVFGLVKQLDGHIFVKSSPENGTQFDLYFPQSENQDDIRTIEGCLTDPNSLKMHGYTVLIVDDEPDLLRITAAMLEDMELNVLCASHPDEALLMQDEYDAPIDLLLTDIAMPDVNGVQLSEMITAIHPEIQTIFMSGFPGRGDMADYLIPEDATFITKPLHFEDLAVIIYGKLTGEHINPDMLRTSQWKEAGHA